MAAQRQQLLKYTGSLLAKKGTQYSGDDFSLGNVFQVKSKNVKLILNSNGVAFDIPYEGIIYVNTDVTYTFSSDCVLAFADMIEVVA